MPASACSYFPATHDLIKKYDVQSPRYTSYPPANHFRDNASPTEYQNYLNQRPTTVGPLSLYVHIPFCRDICFYCACNKIVTRDKNIASRYLHSLEKEIKLKSLFFTESRQVKQLHFGGGTPTFLNPAELMRLMRMLATHFQLVDYDSREYSIEVDPRTIDEEVLALLVGLGFNRISLGIQDFDLQVQEAINRVQSYEMVAGLVKSIKQHGFKSLSFDLIYGLPMQTEESIVQTMDKVIKLSPDRVSVYNYAHMPARFSSQRQMDRYLLPNAETKLALAQRIRQSLLGAGYQGIGMDHYAKTTDELALALQQGTLQRNFQGYSTNMSLETIGLGLSAISTHADRYTQNVHDLARYHELLGNDQMPIEKVCELNREDILRRYVIMALACQMTLNFGEVNKRFNIDFVQHFKSELVQMEQMEQEGLLDLSADSIALTELGRQLLRNICMVFDQYKPLDIAYCSKTI